MVVGAAALGTLVALAAVALERSPVSSRGDATVAHGAASPATEPAVALAIEPSAPVVAAVSAQVSPTIPASDLPPTATAEAGAPPGDGSLYLASSAHGATLAGSTGTIVVAPAAPADCPTCPTQVAQDVPFVPVVPAWAALPSAPLRRGVITYTVQAGDRLFDLAERFGVSMDTLIWANDLPNPDHLLPGRTLRVLPVSGVLHRLAADETLVEVARRYGVDLAALIAVNDFPNPDQVPVGTEIVVPGGRPAAPAAPPAPAERRQPTTYEVAAGDTLHSIAARFGISVATILRSNTIADPDNIPAGTKLTILPQSGLLHEVRPDETLRTLAARYGVSVQEIIAANDLASGDVVAAGQRLLIPERPEWRAAPPAAPQPSPPPTPAAAPPAQPAPATTHRVADGDTLSGIAARYGISLADLRATNRLEDSDVIFVGQELRLPGSTSPAAAPPNAPAPTLAASVRPTEHIVQPGDTLSGIAARYGVSPDELLQLNQLADPHLIGIGQRLRLPGSGAAAGPPPRPAAAPETERYVVQPGDTLVHLAARRGTSVETIIRLNSLREPYLLFVGQEIIVPRAPASAQPAAAPAAPPPAPPAPRYIVQPGDTLSAIAQRYGVAPLTIAEANGLEPPYILAIGRELVIPGGTEPPPTPTPAPRPTAAPAPPPQPTATPAPKPSPQPAPAAPKPQPAPQPPAAAGDMLAIARKQLGARYVWGGSSPETGFDCSGFVAWVFRQAGRYMPRDIWGQVQSGPRVSRDQLQPGDVVFFQNTYTAGLSHNGIYLGNGQFIHAASERVGVIISRLDEPYWAARWYAAVRPAS
jgi:LysM repeat protein